MAGRRAVHRGFIVANMLLLLLSSAACPVYAWNSYGHMLIAYVAYQNLTAKAKERTAGFCVSIHIMNRGKSLSARLSLKMSLT